MPGTLIELWQCNAAGRYHHPVDQHDAPLDPNFTGAGQVVTGADGEYRFVTIKPGAYPWRNTPNAWRPAHIHFGVFGPGFATRIVTQMYFPGDPLLGYDPIFQSTADAAARERLISRTSRSSASRNGRSATASTWYCAAATRRRLEPCLSTGRQWPTS